MTGPGRLFGLPVLAALAAGAVVAYGLMLAFLSRAGFPQSLQTGSAWPFLADKPVGEDAYYMLLVAWNFARDGFFGGNSSGPTTGVQPLAVLVYSILAKASQTLSLSKFDLVRQIIIFNTLLFVLFSHVLGIISRTMAGQKYGNKAYYIAFIISSMSFYIFRVFNYGLETGLYLIFIALSILMHMKTKNGEKFTLKNAMKMGVIFGLAGLSRIDFGVITLFILAYMMFFQRYNPLAVLTTGAIAFILVLPWMLWVYSVSGAIIPSSGPAQSSFIGVGDAPGRMVAMLFALIQNLSPWVYTGGRSLPTLAAAVAGLLLAAWIWKGHRTPGHPVAFQGTGVLIAWGLAFLVLAAVYLVFFWSTHFYARYTSPFVILSVTALSVGLAGARSGLAVRSIRAGLIGFMAFNAAGVFMSFHTGRVGNSHAITAGYVRATLPATERVGAFQSGVVGFFNENVVNLDGKVNSSALRAMQDDRLLDYIEAEDIRFIVDWQSVIRHYLKQQGRPTGWAACDTEIDNGASVCIRLFSGDD